LKIEGATIEEIKSQLNITNKQYEQNIKAMRCFEHISKLQDHIKIQLSSKKEDEEDMSISTQTLEKSKPDRMSIHSIVKKMDKRTIRFDHPLQRSADQWSPVMKGNLISDILQGNPLPELVFAEQVINGIAIIWDLDGKQRCTNAYSFIKDQYRISRNIRRWIIEYQAQVVDENEQVAVDENNFPVYERKECDIRGKKFSDLPEELQEKFQDYNFEITQYLNCNADDIAYHIARYNEGKPATVSQKGIIRLGEEYAATVKSISNMSFFKDMGGYKVSEFKNGVINRVVVESVMAAYYLSNWKKKQEDMCDYIKANAKMVDFENFEELVQRLEKVVTNEVANMFDSKDSFLWFGLFARFAQMKEKDELFIDFMMEFMESLHSKQINNISFDDLNGKSTKDKVVVQRKMMHLETLLQDFIASQEKKGSRISVKNERWEKYVQSFTKTDLIHSLNVSDDEKRILSIQTAMFVQNYSNLDIHTITSYLETAVVEDEEFENILLCMDMLNDWSLEIKDGIELTPNSIPGLIRLAKDALDIEVNDEMMIQLINKWSNHFPKSYSIQQMKEFYLHIKHDFDSVVNNVKKEIA